MNRSLALLLAVLVLVLALLGLAAAAANEEEEEQRPPGDCTEERYEELRNDKKGKCEIPFSCNEHLSCIRLKSYRARADRCARARKAIADECFGGFNERHQREYDAVRRAEENCAFFYHRKCN